MPQEGVHGGILWFRELQSSFHILITVNIIHLLIAVIILIIIVFGIIVVIIIYLHPNTCISDQKRSWLKIYKKEV